MSSQAPAERPASHPPRTLLVTGASGFIGARLCTLAMARGITVHTLTRGEWPAAPFVPAGHRHFGALPDQVPAAALHGIDAIVHCAAQFDGSEQAQHAVNVDGTLRLARMARDAGVGSFVFVSSQSARADAAGSYGRTKYLAEQAVLGEPRLAVVVLRPGLVTGPGARGLYQRMVRLVDRLPVIPLLGGGRALVQPIHVDDLCEAVFRCLERAERFAGSVLCLGDPEGIPLASFLQAIAMARTGRRKPTIAVPLLPIELLARAGEVLRLPLPVNRNNLQGLRRVERMATAGDLARLELRLRPVAAMVEPPAEPARDAATSRGEGPVRVLLVGAGRVGLVHAVTLSRLPGVVLAGIVDAKPKATAFLRGLSLTAPCFRRLEDAIAAVQPDAAVIATPPASHLLLTRLCLAHGIAVLTEKPLALRRDELAEYELLHGQHPQVPVLAGYVMPRNPQVDACLRRLRAGEYGRVVSFLGLTLLSLIREPDPRRWEVDPDASGGGALINAGGHVLSMIHAAFGDPTRLAAASLQLFSSRVEDSLAIRFEYPGFHGRHYCSWSIAGFPRQENTLIVDTDRGRLYLTTALGAFVPADGGEIQLTHQLDFDTGFNLAPDYAGGGFAAELSDLAAAARSRQPAPMHLGAALGVERLLFSVYGAARSVTSFADHEAAPAAAEPGMRIRDDGSAPVAAPRILDLRDLQPDRVRTFLADGAWRAAWTACQVTPGQLAAAPAGARDHLRVTVPDFLAQSRLLGNGQHLAVLRAIGVRGAFAGIAAALRALPRERGVTFWAAARALLAAGLAAVPASFGGTVLLHGYLVDFALALRRLDALESMLQRCRRACPRARIGIHTNMGAEAQNALRLVAARVDEVAMLTSPGGLGLPAVIDRCRRAGVGRVTAEVGLAPAVVHRAAARQPSRWLHGADALLVGPAADESLRSEHAAGLRQAWSAAFPGIALPGAVTP